MYKGKEDSSNTKATFSQGIFIATMQFIVFGRFIYFILHEGGLSTTCW